MYFYFFIYNPKTRSDDETERSCRELENLAQFSKQLQAAATVTITHQEIWTSKSSDVGKADCPTNKYSQLVDRECCKGM